MASSVNAVLADILFAKRESNSEAAKYGGTGQKQGVEESASERQQQENPVVADTPTSDEPSSVAEKSGKKNKDEEEEEEEEEEKTSPPISEPVAKNISERKKVKRKGSHRDPLVELVSFLPENRQKSARAFAEALLSSEDIDVKDGEIWEGGKKVGHLTAILSHLFLPEPKTIEEARLRRLFWQSFKGSRSNYKALKHTRDFQL